MRRCASTIAFTLLVGMLARSAVADTCPVAPSTIDGAATVLGLLALDLAPGAWAEVIAPGLDRELLYIDANGLDGSTAHTDWSDELHWDRDSQTVYFIGAGHLRSFGFIQYQGATNSWCRHDEGLPSCMYETGYSGCFTHSYDQQAYDPVSRRLYLGAGLWLGEYDIATRAWSERSFPSGTPTGYGAIVEHYPPTGELFVYIGGTGVLNTVGGANRPVVANLATGPYHNVGVYTAPADLMIFGGGNGSSSLVALRADGSIDDIPDAPAEVHVAYSTLTVDPNTGEVLFLTATGAFHAYNPTTREWRRLPDTPFASTQRTRSRLQSPIMASSSSCCRKTTIAPSSTDTHKLRRPRPMKHHQAHPRISWSANASLTPAAVVAFALLIVGCGGGSVRGGAETPADGESTLGDSDGNTPLGEASLTWDAPTTSSDGRPLADLAGYYVYVGTAPGVYGPAIDVGDTTSYRATNLTPGTRYYFAVSAYDRQRNESALSSEVAKDVQ